ncbi:MAG: ABC transporter ATP-binding protein [Clostridia bacterium]|nr:ABC transporter ATP-binding protein [Clostridia bacterium]
MLKRFLKCVREYKRPTIVTLVLIMLEVVIDVIIPFIVARLVNDIRAGIKMAEILKTGGVLFVMAIASLLCGGIAGFSSAKAAAGFAKNVRHDVFSKINSFSFGNIDKFSTSSLTTRLTTDITNVQMSYMMLIRIAVRAPLMLIFSIVMAYIMGGSLAGTFVVVIPVLVFGLLMVAKYAMPAFRSVFKKYDKLNESVEENVRGMRVVKGFAREEFEKKKFNKAADDIRADFTKAERIVALNAPIMQFCIYFNMIFVMTAGSYIIIGHKSGINVGELSSMLTYGMQILINLMMLSMIYVMLTMSAESMKRIVEVLNEEPTIKDPENPVTFVADGSVVFKNVNFKYERKAKEYALKNINIDIPSGATVGILGGTGSGKTALVSLIPRLYDTDSGEVLVGGVNVKDYLKYDLRNAVACVLQKNLLFSGTIKDNLRWGNENATDSEIKEACKLACCDEFIDTFKDGYDTKIEQGGTNVSGGQKQRLCIARALLKKPKILILDDSTSAVDTKTDAEIRAGLKKYLPNTTKIVIAQRVSSISDSDMIIILDGGEVSGIGTHSELLATNEIYKEMYIQQTNGGEENA